MSQELCAHWANPTPLNSIPTSWSTCLINNKFSRLLAFWLKSRMSLYFLFIDLGSCVSPTELQHIANEDLGLLFILPQFPECWGHRQVPHTVYVVLGMYPRALTCWVSTLQAAAPAPYTFVLKLIKCNQDGKANTHRFECERDHVSPRLHPQDMFLPHLHTVTHINTCTTLFHLEHKLISHL